MLNNKNKRTNEKDHLKIRLQNYNRSSLGVESYIEIVRVGWVGVRQLSGTGSKYREREHYTEAMVNYSNKKIRNQL